MTSPVHVVVVAALVRGHDVLLCHRSPERRWYPDVWDFPGGHVEPDESPRAALVRELWEEVGVVVSVDSLPETPDFPRAGEGLDLSLWKVTSWSGQPRNLVPEEHDSIGWFALPDALGLSLADESYPAILTALCS